MNIPIKTSFSYKINVLGYKLFTVYFKWSFCFSQDADDSCEKDYLTDTFGSAERQAKEDHPDWIIDRVGVFP